MLLITPISTSRLSLRCLTSADANERYLHWLEDKEINRFLESRFSKHSLASTAEFIGTVNSSDDTILLGLFQKDGDRHIGNIKLGPINIHHNNAEIGIMIGDKTAWGKGYATEAIEAVSMYAFETLGVRKLTAGYYAENEGSGRAFRKVGFKDEGLKVGHWVNADGEIVDGVILGCFKHYLDS